MSLRPADSPTGVGLGLRASFAAEVDAGAAEGRVPFFEISPENYMRRGGLAPARLARIADKFPVLTHGLAMGMGGLEAFDPAYFAALRSCLASISPDRWHSDHLCFGSIDGKVLHDLLPLPFTSACAKRVAARVREAQDRLERRLLVENISYYVPLGHAETDEPGFVSEVLDAADCGLLLDVNNVFVNAYNHGFDPLRWLEQIDLDRVVQLHVAGHEHWEDDAGLIIDTHGAAVRSEVDQLLAWVVGKIGPVPVVLERDNNIPELDVLLEERDRVAAIYDAAVAHWQETSRP